MDRAEMVEVLEEEIVDDEEDLDQLSILAGEGGRPQPSTPAATPIARPPPPRPAPVRQPSPPLDESETFDYEVLTDDLAATWETDGKEKLRGIVQTVVDDIAIGSWIQELVRSAIRRRIDPKSAGEFFKDFLEQRKSEDPETAVADIFVDTVALTPAPDWRRSSTSQLVFASGIPAETWRLALETDCIEALGMSREKFTRQKTRLITNHLYRQSNYNLLREESEGYAKLITEYFNLAFNASASDSSPTLALDAFERVKALVGSFDLDAGRVLDITLDVFANLLVRNFRFFVKFIRASSWWPELECPDVIKWSGQGFDTLPDWALPSSRDWGVGAEETDRLARLKPLIEARDLQFWDEVRKHGLDAFSEIGTQTITNFDDGAVQALLNSELEAKDDDKDRNGVEKNKIKRLRLNDRRKWMRTTKTLPPLGNPDAANLLGFKLAFYTSPARDKSDVMPENLIYLSALLIKIGFISLRDLYPHLHPPDDKMDEVKTRLEKELEEREYANRPGGGPNKLAMSGALPDDTVPAVPAIKSLRDTSSSKASSPKPETTPKPGEDAPEQLSEPPDQKIALLKSLLVIGAIPEALFILGRFPWLADLVPDLPRHIHRILHHMLSKVYETTRPLSDREDMDLAAAQIGDPAGLPKGTLNLKTPQQRRAKRWAAMDTSDDGDGISYKFYWDDWSDNVPICQTVDDVFLMCSTFLNLSGVKIGQDPSLLLKLARIGKRSLAEDRSHDNEARWVDLLKRILVPALSLTTRNPNAANEVFDLLRLFPTATRYAIYAEWHFGPTARLPDMKKAFDRTRLESRDVLKRISKTNIRSMGKSLAKIAYGSPGIVLQTAINQMESYENLIEVFVECSRYFTFLGYDVLTWCLLNALGGNSRDRIQKDGMLTSSWLRALSSFAGAIYKRYNLCDPTPVLHYVASELRKGNSTDLELLEQMIVAMAGIKSDMAFNEAQTLAMAGGELLQAQTLKQMADERHKNEKTSKRLMKCLSDSGLAGQILISIAQERQMYTTRDAASAAPLKVLGNNVDKIHQVFIQYLEAFRSNTTVEAFAAAVPDPVALMRDFGLDADIAFMIGRAGIAQQVARIDAQRKAELQEKARARSGTPVLTNGDISMADADSATVEPSTTDANAQDVKADVEDISAVKMEGIEEGEEKPDTSLTNGTESDGIVKSETPAQYLHPALTNLVDAIPAILGYETSSSLSIPFYVTFWTLGLQDIVVNTSSYNQELAHQTSLANQIKNDRSDPSALGAKERERKIKAINELKDKLAAEMKTQIGAYTQVRERLTKEKDHWFSGFHNKVVLLANSLLQNCFIPRVLLSPLDAHYTFTMIKFLHNNGTPGFRTMHLYDNLFKKNLLVTLIFGATAREAENLGRFLYEALKDLRVWHADEKVYEKNAWGPKKQLPGFARSFKDGVPETFLDYQPFRTLLFKWHSLTKNALSACFESDEYMHIRNGIIVLKSLLPQFPVVNFMGSEMIKKVSLISEKDTRGDLKLAALSLLGSLKPLEKDFLLVQQFHMAQFPHPADAQANGTSRSTPTPANLNAEAAEFKPGASVSSTSNKANADTGDAEDGEIDDDKKTGTDSKGDSLEIDSTGTLKPSASARPLQQINKPMQDLHRQATPSRAPETPTRDAGRSTPVGRPGQDRRMDSETRPSVRPDSRNSGRPDERPPRASSRLNPSNDSYGRLDRPSDLGQAPNRPDARDDIRDDGRSTPRSQQGDSRFPSRGGEQRGGRDVRDTPTGPANSSNRTPLRVDDVPNGPKVNGASTPAATAPADGVNPARRALIEGNRRADDSPRPQQDGRGSRASSPRRDGRVPQQQGPLPSDRARGPLTQQGSGDRRTDQAPTGPRQDDTPRRPSSDLFTSRPSNQAPGRSSDPTYGRLNAPDAPSGPRSAANDRRAPLNGPQAGPRSGTSPTAPSQQFAQTRNGGRPERGPGSAPSTPAREPDVPAVANVHPSRRAHVEPVDTKSARNAALAPGGPQSATPTGPSPASRAPAPGGPRNDRRFASLNDTLSGSPNQGTQVRGRASRTNSTAAPVGPAISAPNGSQQMPPPQAGPARPAEPQRTPSGRVTRASEQGPPTSPTGPRSAYDQRADYPPQQAREPPRSAPRSGPNGRDPSRDSAGRDDRRLDYRGPPEADPRIRPARDEYRDYPDSRGGYGREDPYARGGPPPSARPVSGYGADPRYPPSQDPYAASRRPMDDSRGPPASGDYRMADSRAGYGPPPPQRGDPREHGWARGDDGRDARKRRGDDMAADPTKRRRSGQ
ncbi:THO complex subunit 2-like protein [Elsinoe fawcettii]|nr:THO complex subunit 2-like protein [Elsinoe fawcettii]